MNQNSEIKLVVASTANDPNESITIIKENAVQVSYKIYVFCNGHRLRVITIIVITYNNN